MATLCAAVVAVVLHALLAAPVSAATYFVDSARGNDKWTGKAPDPTGSPASDGPWQSLAKVSATGLAAGDVVALRCGSRWSESLKITSSGTPSAPISIQSYPNPCSGEGPLIDGFSRPGGLSWKRQAANTYKLTFPVDLLAGTGFEAGLDRWQIWSRSNDAILAVLAGCGPTGNRCAQITSGGGSETSVAYSTNFSLVSGVAYRLKFDVKAAPGTRLRAFVRRAVAPYDTVGAATTLQGTGAWQSISLPFTAQLQLDNARLDFDLPPGGFSALIDNVAVEQVIDAPTSVRLAGEAQTIAHHPNRGFNSLEPTSLYFKAGADADAVSTSGGIGSTYIPIAADIGAATAALAVGATIRIRSNAWNIDERIVTGFSGGNRLLLDRPTSYPVKAGWGYYLLGSPWMLDEAGEWHFDKATATLTVKTKTDTPPTGALALGTLPWCLDVSGTANLVVDGLGMTGCRTAVLATSGKSITLRRLRVLDVSGNGVLAPATQALQVLSSRFERIGEHAVLGKEGLLPMATGMVLSANTLIDIGVLRVGGSVVSLPVGALGSVLPGEAASVLNNWVSGSAYHGIRIFGNGTVKGNTVEAACLILDDCAGIYAFGSSAGSRIESNVVRDIPGGLAGKPAGTTSQAQGIFLDDHANGVVVLNNTVSAAETGIFLHNAFNNTIQGNTLYGNRKHQIWLLEDSTARNPSGDLYGNVVVDNAFFGTLPNAAVGQQSLVNEPSRFASYDRNRYSALLSNRVVLEDWPSGSGAFDFASWQRATTPGGTLRLLDQSGSVLNPIGYASYQVVGSSILRNGNMTAGATEWTPWNDTAPLATATAVTCGAQTCLDVVAGATATLVASPPFSTVAGNWYRVSFDARSAVDGQSLAVRVRRGGGGSNGYESLMGSPEMVTAQTRLQRFAFAFKATQTIKAADPVTRDIGARLYFERINPGNRISLANVEVVPLSAADAATQTRLFSNPDAIATSAMCPESVSNPAKCLQYVDFRTGAKVTWPLYLAPYSSTIVYTRDLSLVDSDGDGIVDLLDSCPGTAPGVVTNAKGCGL